MYNVILYKYQNSYQIRSYQFGIKEGKKKNNSFDSTEDEIDQAFKQIDEKYHFDGKSSYVSVNRSKNKIYFYSRSNDWSNGWFVTLTIDPKKYDSFDYKVVSKLARNFARCIHRYDNNSYGIIVPELHKSGRFHLHGIIAGIDLEKEGYVQNSGHKINNEIIYNFIKGWSAGFSTCTRVRSSLAVEKYIAKYTTKELLNDTRYQHRYFTFNLHEADILKYNIYKEDDFIQELYRSGQVLFGNTDGLYNRVTYLEVSKSEKIEQILNDFLNKSP